MRGTFSNFFVRLMCLLVLGTGCAAIASERAEYDLSIDPQPLKEALKDFAQQSGLQIVFYTDLAAGIKAPAVKGKLTTDQALKELLKGTSLTYRHINSTTVEVSDTALRKISINSQSESGWLRLADDAADRFKARTAQAADSPSVAEASDKSANKELGIQEIVVTAQKREERVSDVPISISVLTADDIDRRGLVNAEDYLRGMPGVNQSFGYGGQSVVIRGTESILVYQNANSGPTTGYYFGETPTTTSAGTWGSAVDIKLVDMERVEVLRGPQGTAFGSSSMGGTVRQIPIAPKLNQYDFRLGAGYSSTSGTGGSNYQFQAVGNIPLIEDKLALRAVAYSFSDSGIYRNRAGSNAAFVTNVAQRWGAEAFATDEDHVGGFDSTGGRLSALFQASDNLNFTVNLLKQDNETHGYPLQTNASYEQLTLRVAPEHVYRGQHGGVIDYSIELANAVMNYDLSRGNLIATYSRVKGGGMLIQPWSMFDYLPWALSSKGDATEDQHFGEIRYVSELDGAWNFLTGLYFEKLDSGFDYDAVWYGDPALSLLGPAAGRLMTATVFHSTIEQKAAFSEVSWKFLPRFTLTGGVRAFKYDRANGASSWGAFNGPNVVTNGFQMDASGTTFRGNLSFKPTDDSLLYASWSEGFRLGKPQSPPAQICDADGDGFVNNSTISMESLSVLNSDEVTNYEIGGKLAAAGGRFSIEADVFRMDWTDFPGRVELDCGVLGKSLHLASIGQARSEGVELQMSLLATDSIRIYAGGSHLRAQLTEDIPAQGYKAGQRLPGSPETNGNLGVQYDFMLGSRGASLRADAIYVGSFFTVLNELPVTKTDSYVKLDVSARFAFDDNLSVDLFVKNLTNSDAYTFRAPYANNGHNGLRLFPRTVGVQLGYHFGR